MGWYGICFKLFFSLKCCCPAKFAFMTSTRSKRVVTFCVLNLLHSFKDSLIKQNSGLT